MNGPTTGGRSLPTYRSLRRLYPLWMALYRATPEIALLPPPSRLADVLTLRDPTFRLYRRVIEIQDGRLALRPYADARVEDIVSDLSHGTHLGEDERRAMVEAAQVAAAIRRKAAGRSTAFGAPSQPTVGGTDIAGEATALERVAHWYAHSSLVQDVVQRLDQPRSGSVEGSL